MHVNLTNIQYNHLNTALKYSIDNSEKVIHYSSEELQDVVGNERKWVYGRVQNLWVRIQNILVKPLVDIRKAFLKEHP